MATEPEVAREPAISRIRHADGDSATDSARGLTLLQSAAKEREQRAKHLFLDVPSWSGDLIAEYRVLDDPELEEIAETSIRRGRNGKPDILGSDIRMIVRACVGLHALDPESGDRVPIEDEHGIVNYGRICKILGHEEISSNAEAVKYLTGERDDAGNGWKPNPTAINTHANHIARWMRDPSKRNFTIEELLGE